MARITAKTLIMAFLKQQGKACKKATIILELELNKFTASQALTKMRKNKIVRLVYHKYWHLHERWLIDNVEVTEKLEELTVMEELEEMKDLVELEQLEEVE